MPLKLLQLVNTLAVAGASHYLRLFQTLNKLLGLVEIAGDWLTFRLFFADADYVFRTVFQLISKSFDLPAKLLGLSFIPQLLSVIPELYVFLLQRLRLDGHIEQLGLEIFIFLSQPPINLSFLLDMFF